jgi:outer membrane protein assembly factor BamB
MCSILAVELFAVEFRNDGLNTDFTFKAVDLRTLLSQTWYNPDVSMWMNTPVLSGDFLFRLSQKNRGQFFCLDARTGRVLWVSEKRAGDYAAILKVDDNLFMQTTDSNLIVAKISGKGYEPLRRYQVADSETWAHPAVVKNMIVVKDVEHLAVWGLS